MPDAPSRVFEANARLHVGVLGASALVHAQHWYVSATPNAKAISGAYALCAVLMLLGRLHVWRTGQCRAWHATCTHVWCVVVSVCYLGAAASGDPTVHLELAMSDSLGACVMVLLCTLAGVLHASLGPSAAQSGACVGCMALSCAAVLVARLDAQALLFVLSAAGGHVLGATLSAEIFAQRVCNMRFERTIEQQSCRQERTDYDLALSLKDAKKARRALDEVIRTVYAFESASAPRPARRVCRAPTVVMGKPLFKLAEEAMDRDRKIAAATTTAELEVAEAIVSLDQLRSSESDCDTDEEHETPDEHLKLPNVLARVKAAATPLSVDGSLRSSDDSPVVTRRGCYEEADAEYDSSLSVSWNDVNYRKHNTY